MCLTEIKCRTLLSSLFKKLTGLVEVTAWSNHGCALRSTVMNQKNYIKVPKKFAFFSQHQWPKQKAPPKVRKILENRTGLEIQILLESFSTHIAAGWAFKCPCASHRELLSHKAVLWLSYINITSTITLLQQDLFSSSHFYFSSFTESGNALKV